MKIKQPSENEARFIFYSIRERIALQQLALDMGIKITNVSDEEGFASWDAITKYGDERQVIEIKIRKKLTTSFPDFILEYKKWFSLLDVASGEEGLKAQLKPTFMVFFFDAVAIWDMEQVKEEDFFMEELRASSVDGNTCTRQKKITKLKLQDATVWPFKLDYEKLDELAKTVFTYRYPNTKLIINDYE